MNKRYLLLIPIVPLIIIISINLFKLISYKLEIRKYEKMFLDYYNLKISDGLSNQCVLNIKDYLDRRPIEYDITELIDYYLLQIKNIRENRNENNFISTQFYKNTRYHIDLAYNYSKYISENNIDINYVLKELKKF